MRSIHSTFSLLLASFGFLVVKTMLNRLPNILSIAVLLGCFSFVNTARGETAVFAGGCFWCVEAAYQELEGVSRVVSGFTGGSLPNPTYSGNHEGHFEAVMVTFDATQISYEKLLEVFWHNIDPFDDEGQFCDRGPGYRSAVFVKGAEQRALAEQSREAVVTEFESQAVATQILPARRFWPVESAHQDYYLKNPIRYRLYRASCGRDNRLSAIWGDRAKH